MIKVAITGNIASGKSTVEKIIEDCGYKVFDSDKIAHEILDKSEEVRFLFRVFDVFNDGKIDRTKLGKIVFDNKDLLTTLENIIHPLVKKELNTIFEKNKDEKVVFVSVPQLFEANFQDIFDKIIFISTNKEIRLERLIKRNNYTKEYALKRIEAQLPDEIKAQKSDYIIENNSDLESLNINTKNILSSIC